MIGLEKTRLMKKKVLEALERGLGIVSAACNEVGISRNTFYMWYKEDPEFKRDVDELNDVTLDFVENQLLKKVKEGSERSILFYMKYKGKKRGYNDSLDITSGGDKITEIKLIKVEGKDEIGD